MGRRGCMASGRRIGASLMNKVTSIGLLAQAENICKDLIASKKIHKVYHKIDVPNRKIDIYAQPILPVQSITVDCKITKL